MCIQGPELRLDVNHDKVLEARELNELRTKFRLGGVGGPIKGYTTNLVQGSYPIARAMLKPSSLFVQRGAHSEQDPSCWS